MDFFEIIINILIFINLYWYIIPAILGIGVYIAFLKIVTFPLLARQPHDFIIIAKPEKIIIKKVTNRIYPYFMFKQGLYWFATPSQDVQNFNRYHIYIEGLNQDVTEPNRREGKLSDLINHKLSLKQIGSHQIYIMKNIKDHLHKHYSLTIDPVNKIAQLNQVDEPQQFKLSFHHTLGLYIQEIKEETQTTELESATSTKTILTSLTTETIINQIKFIQSYSYFSANFAYSLHKKLHRINSNFVTWAKGATDPKLLMMIIMLAAGMGVVVLLMFAMKPDLGPMPTG